MSLLNLCLELFTVVVVSHLASGNDINEVTKRGDVSALVSLYSNPIDIKATYYGEYPGGGACALDPAPTLATQSDWILVAAAERFVQGSLGCGMCLEITGEGEGSGNNPIIGPIRASVHDRCLAGVDLFVPGDGVWKVKAKAVNCPDVPGSDGKIQFRFTGSNPWSFKLQARNTRVPTKSMEIFGKGKWNDLRRTSDNYFNNNGLGLGKINFPIKIRVTSIFGERLETTLPRLLNDKNIPSKIQYKGFGGSTGGAGGNGGGNGGGETTPKPTKGPVTTPGSTPTPGGGSKPGGGGGSGGKGHFCEGKAPGMYADPTDCRYFYKCANGAGERIPCAPGLQFNPKTMNCDWPSNVKCKAKKN